MNLQVAKEKLKDSDVHLNNALEAAERTIDLQRPTGNEYDHIVIAR